MRNSIKNTLTAIDTALNRVQPKTMDELIETVHNVQGAGNYGTSFSIVKYMGEVQGVRVYVTGRSKTHQLPTRNRVYSVLQGIEKYEKAGYKVEIS